MPDAPQATAPIFRFRALPLAEIAVQQEVFHFGLFGLSADGRLLERNNQPVKLGSRAFDILLVLVERAGEAVTKEQLTARVWPETYVEQANLRVHIAALRRALATDDPHGRFIENIPGRGYSFVAEIKRNVISENIRMVAKTVSRPCGLPLPVSRVFSRTETVEDLTVLLSQRRINVSLPGLDRDVAQTIVDRAHQTCPYSKATRGNIDVTITLV